MFADQSPLELRTADGVLRRSARWGLAACACAALVACGGGGGGGEADGVAATGARAVTTGFVALGSIDGLGSISVNGVRLDTSAASVTNINAAPINAALCSARTSANLDPQLGMTVSVRGDLNPDNRTGAARQVEIASAFKGPVTGGVEHSTAGDVEHGALVVFGRTAEVTRYTVFAGDIDGTRATLSRIRNGHVIEVYGLPLPDGRLRATRIEFEAASVADFMAAHPGQCFHVTDRLGLVVGAEHSHRQPEEERPLRQLLIAGVEYRETPRNPLPQDLPVGAKVTVSFALPRGFDPQHYLLAPNIDVLALRAEPARSAGDAGFAVIEGWVDGWDAAAGTFTVEGLPVALGAGMVFDNGVRDNLGKVERENWFAPVHVEVFGAVVDGRIVASRVRFEDERRFTGQATCKPPCDPASGRFTVPARSTASPPAGSEPPPPITIEYDAATRFVDGATRETLDGMRVEVYAKVQPSPGAGAGNRFVATKIARKD